jgi:hypothetical protein
MTTSGADKAFEVLLNKTEKLSFAKSITRLHDEFRSLAERDFLDPKKPWANAFELAALAKFIFLHGSIRRSEEPDMAGALNAVKDLWREADLDTHYPDSPQYIASFVLRFVYQQLPFNLTRRKMQQNVERTLGIFGGNSTASAILRDKFETSASVRLEDFLRISNVIYSLFRDHSNLSENALLDALTGRLDHSLVNNTLHVISTTRGGFRKYHESVASTIATGVPYEFNTLLRYPIVLSEGHYWCVFAELINYAATRGLYFYVADRLGQQFSSAFADAYEEYVSQICTDALGIESVMTERTEKALNWTGKNNDVTLIFGDIAVLLECKNSGLFSLSKRSGMPIDLAADIRKNLANAEKRKGLFQLFDKIKCIADGEIPEAVKPKYSNVSKFYPVILLHDEIWFANRPETLKNLIDAELEKNGIIGFDYQIWQVEELEILLKAVPADQIAAVIEDKFTNLKSKTWDLSSYLSDKYGLPNLGINMFVPRGESKPFNILRALARSE